MIKELLITQANVEMAASFAMETRRMPDPYFFVFKEGLHSPQTGQPVKESILKETPLQKREYAAFEKIENWVKENRSGISLWFSPQFAGEYEASKVVVSQIVSEKDNKFLVNRALVLDITGEECLAVANLLEKEKTEDPEILREKPIFLKNEDLFAVVGILEKLDQKQMAMVKNNADVKEKNYTLKRIEESLKTIPVYQANNRSFDYLQAVKVAEANKLVGVAPGSCGGGEKTSAFKVFSNNSVNLKESSFPCPRCHKAIPSGKGITTCPHCGAKKEDYKKCV